LALLTGGGVGEMHQETVSMKLRIRQGWIVLWYVSIGIGFALLALRAYILGAGAGAVVLRLIIAVGFAALAWIQNQQRKQQNRN
jgi:hypothetical protein